MEVVLSLLLSWGNRCVTVIFPGGLSGRESRSISAPPSMNSL